jgi:3-hydroxybutyryl-CoA dehydratase
MLAREELSVGLELPVLEREVRQAQVDLYADAAEDHNPIHIDPDFARQTPLGGTIAHGMLILAYASELLSATFGDAYTTRGSLDARFKNPARPGDVIRVSGQVTKLEPDADGLVVTCQFNCENQNADTVIVGKAKVRY